MEDLIFELLAALLEPLLEVLLEVVIGELLAFLWRALSLSMEDSRPGSAVVVTIFYVGLGMMTGGVTLLFLPPPLFHPWKFRGISLIVSPIVTGLIMSRIEMRTVQIESFGYAAAFALGTAFIRLWFVH